MITKLLSKIFGNRNERILKQLSKNVAIINSLESQFTALSDAELHAKTSEFRRRLQEGIKLDDLLPEAFAAVREAAKRVLKMRHFDVQLIGGMVLHSGRIAEMRTGEGKTLMATLAAYLNALPGRGVHIVTVNDYLAKRDAEWMRPVYEFLGLTTGIILTTLSPIERREAYSADITYGTNNEFGFDYLRDNMAFSLADKVQREPNFAIVDEVDSILIDEARTPLIISGASEESSELYISINKIIPYLTKREEEKGPGDFYLDEKTKQAYLTEAGHQHVEELLVEEGLLQAGHSLYEPANIGLMHHVYAALRANTLFHRDVEYIVQNGQIMIVDEHTGRVLPGRRWSDGLHQAIEAKENVQIQSENQTLASITFQNYFRLYNKLAGMTGTADTEAYEFQQIYGLEVIVIPTNKAICRTDYADKVYISIDEKFAAIIEEIKNCQNRKQPVLVGTASIDNSEKLAELLTKANISHQVLNAKFHEKEAHIIAQAGRPGAVTIATNMAGRGTDIVLGGNLESELADLPEDTTAEEIENRHAQWKQRHEQVINAGGLHIIGSERHESRRIDNQLRGRAGRQGDPGSSSFYISLQDNLMRIFAAERMAPLMQRFGMEKGQAIEHPWINRAIENAQRKVEAHNFDIRKHLLEYDDIANAQRKVIYEQRNALLADDDVSESVVTIREDVLQELINIYIPPQSLEEQWNIAGLEERITADFNKSLPLQKWLEEDHSLHEENLRTKILDEFNSVYQHKETLVGSSALRQIEKSVLLQSLDTHWREHLATMDHLRQSIHLRGYAQKNPKQEYKREAFELFSSMLDKFKFNVLSILSKLEIQTPTDVEIAEQQRRQQMPQQLHYQHAEVTAISGDENVEQPAAESEEAKQNTFVREAPKVGRNDACPCGSGKKYKQCHGSLV